MNALVLDRTLTELDHVRLAHLTRVDATVSDDLQLLLDSARLVPAREVPPDVVTMSSRVLLVFPDGRRETLAIRYPKDAAPSEGQVSVLSPVGTSLLGLRVGETARWQMPSGQNASAEVAEILFQPEASGDYLA